LFEARSRGATRRAGSSATADTGTEVLTVRQQRQTQIINKDQLSLTTLRDALRHGERSASK